MFCGGTVTEKTGLMVQLAQATGRQHKLPTPIYQEGQRCSYGRQPSLASPTRRRLMAEGMIVASTVAVRSRLRCVMTRDEIIQRIMEYIDVQLDGDLGEMCEETCREVFFDLFAEAYNQGLITNKSLTVGALLTTLQDKWYSDPDERNIDRADFLELLLLYWYAWQYAWEQYENKHAE